MIAQKIPAPFKAKEVAEQLWEAHQLGELNSFEWLTQYTVMLDDIMELGFSTHQLREEMKECFIYLVCFHRQDILQLNEKLNLSAKICISDAIQLLSNNQAFSAMKRLGRAAQYQYGFTKPANWF